MCVCACVCVCVCVCFSNISVYIKYVSLVIYAYIIEETLSFPLLGSRRHFSLTDPVGP